MGSNLTRRRFIKLSGAAALSVAVPPFLRASDNLIVDVSKRWKPYKNTIVIDGLSGALGARTKTLTPEQIALFKQSGITAVNTTVPYPGDNFDATEKKISHVLQLIKQYSDDLSLIKSVADIESTKRSGKLGTIIGFQSTEMFGDDLSRIAYFANRGARYMQLSYNGPSQFGSGGLVQADTGITLLGREAIKAMEEARVLVDLSHSGQKTVADAIKVSKKPLTISHTGCNALFKHPRNNDDAELKAVADKGGVVGIYLMPFLEGGISEIKAEMVIKHISHAINICGEDHVSIGSDQGVIPINDTPEYRESIRKEVARRKAAGISAPGETHHRPPFIPELNAVNRMELVAWYMSKGKVSDRVIEKVLGKNLMNLYAHVW